MHCDVIRCSKHLARYFRSNALHASFFPEPIDPSLLQMIDSEASRHRGDSHASSSDSLHEVLFKDPPVTPPPVAVNMCAPPAPRPQLTSRRLGLTRVQECGGRLRSCSAGVSAPAPSVEVFIRNSLTLTHTAL
jgi:hypothetical protein